MWCRVNLVTTDVSEELVDFIFGLKKHLEYGDDVFLQNVASYKIHTPIYLRRRHSS
jgi:hypothetical protein